MTEPVDIPRLERSHANSRPRCETYHLLTMGRMSITRGVPDFQLGQFWNRAPFIVEHDAYVDCERCRVERRAYRNVAALARAAQNDSFWCNTCQGTGWAIESWDEARTRLKIVTWKDRARDLTTVDLLALHHHPRDRGEWPHAVVLDEIARRLETAQT